MIRRATGSAPSTRNLMKRVAAISVACLVVILCVLAGPSRHIAHGSVLNYKAVPLESLPIAGNSEGVSVISPGNAGHYRGDAITHGLQLTIAGYTHGEFHLRRQYDELSGTVYADDAGEGETPTFDIYDSSNAAHKEVLYTVPLGPDQKASFKVPVHGVDFIMVAMDNPGTLDIVATLSSGTRVPLPPKKPTQVIPRYPTNGAGVSANSKVLFGWQPFPHATSYAFHVWLVGLSGSASLTSTTPFSFSASIYHKTSYTWDDHGFLPGTYQYSLLPLDDQGHNLAGWGTPTQITIAS